MSTIKDTDVFLVSRGGVDHQVSASGIDGKLQDTDLVLINRDGIDHKVSGADLRAYLDI